jgi:hypothetical protein
VQRMCQIQLATFAVIKKACCRGYPSLVLDARYRRTPCNASYAIREQVRGIASISVGGVEGHAPTAKPNPSLRHGLSANVPGEFALPRVLRFLL